MKSKSLVLSNTYVTKVQKLDALGQGVCTIDGHTVFVPKTLPGEEIEIMIHAKKQGVYFAHLEKILFAASQRINSECPHFSTCAGCSYLHVDYPQELVFKKQALECNLSYLSNKNYSLEVVATPYRYAYRNRIQLHYQLGPNASIGFMNKQNIVPIDLCLLPEKILQNFLQDFLQKWQKILPAHSPPQGHVELQLFGNEVSVSWNSAYSQWGFTQVNESANQLLKNLLQQFYLNSSARSVLELFCGRGNLLSFLQTPHNLVGFDLQGSLPSPHIFHQANLFEHQGLQLVLEECHKYSFDDLVLDPPRSGFNSLVDVVQACSPERLLYVSCWPSTMVRDLNLVHKFKPWKQAHVFLIDMFPGTKHYETFIALNW